MSLYKQDGLSSRSIGYERNLFKTPADPAEKQGDPFLGGVGGFALGRSYRRLLLGARRTYIMSVLFIAALQGAAFFGISAAATAFTKFAVYALSLSGLYAREGNAPFLSMTFPVAFIDIPPPHLTDILLCMGVGVGIIVALRLYPSRTPAYYVLVTGALIVVASAAQLLLMGRPSYEAGDFSSAVLRTSLLIWALAPTLLGVVSLLFPFRLRERAALLLLASAIDFFFSIARYAVVLGVLATVGPIALPSALIFAGPILDALVYVAVFSSSLAALSRRLSLSPELWRWSLH